MRKFFVIAAVAAALVLVPQVTQAQFKAGDWTLAISGTGAHSPDLDGTTIGMQGQLGYFLSNTLELSLRQSVSYTDLTEGGSAWAGFTAVALDLHFDMGKLQPYVGANLGYAYGDINDDWIAGPEAGIKFFVNSTTYIQLQVEYQCFICESLSDGQFVYGLSVGFRL